MMKKSMLALIMALILVFTLAVPAAWANDSTESKIGNLFNKIRSVFNKDDAAEKKYTVENRVKEFLISLDEKAKEEGVEIEDILDQMLDSLKNGEGKLDIASIASLVGSLMGSEDNESEEVALDDIQSSPYFQERIKRDDAVEAYLLDEYKDSLEPGDVHIVVEHIISTDDDDPLINLGYFSLTNYTADGKDLIIKNFAGGIELITFTKDENEAYVLAEAIHVEDDEEYASNITAICEKYGIKEERFYGGMEQRDYYDSSAVYYYLLEHPEYERIEYNGEMKTTEEMEAIMDEALAVIFAPIAEMFAE